MPPRAAPTRTAPECPLEVTPEEACALVKAHPGQCLILDVREPHELEICRVAGSDSVPMGQVPALLTTLPRDRHLLVLCHHGGRSRRVTQFLRAQGFTTVTNIAGGIEAWACQVDPKLARY